MNSFAYLGEMIGCKSEIGLIWKVEVQLQPLLCFDESKCGKILDPKHNNDKIGWFTPNIYWSRYEF